MNPSKILIGAILFCVLTSSSIAQVSLRPQVGVNFPSFTDEIVHGKFKGNAGYQFGADLQIGKTLFIQPGANFQTDAIELERVGDIRVSRLNVPILLGLRLIQSDYRAFGLRVFAGPNFAFNLNEDLDDAFDQIDIEREDLNNFQLAGLLGAGLDIGVVFVDLGYKIGLTKYFESNLDGSVNLFLLNVGVRLGF